MKVLWIVPKWPFPIADGARIATTQLLNNVTRLGISVHLAAIVPEQEHIDEGIAKKHLGVDAISIIRRHNRNRWRLFLALLKRPWFPVTLASYGNRKIAKAILNTLESEHFDLVIYDGLHAAAWKTFTQGKKKGFKEAYRAHNVENEIWFRAARDCKSWLKKILFYYQGVLVKRAEKKLIRECQLVLPVSTSDEKKFQNYMEFGDIHTVPIGISVRESTPEHPFLRGDRSKKILFVGRLDWAPNRHGLEWLLREVWPAVAEKTIDLSLVIVGSGDGRWLEPYLQLPGVRFEGRVDSLEPYYRECIATLVPIFYGSGTRVKVIESILHARACISTEMGVEGVGLVAGESYHRVETAREWIQTLVDLPVESFLGMGRVAHAYAKSMFDPEIIAQRFVEKISILRSNHGIPRQ